MLENQPNDDSIDYVMKNTRTHVLVAMNPDGIEQAIVGDCIGKTGRNNSNNFDLNRNFPDYFECNRLALQPETKHVIDWLHKNDFILSAAFHTGSMVVSYPYDNIEKNSKSNLSLTMDNDVFVSLALTYSTNHAKMVNAKCGEESFPNKGITNGANWPPPIKVY